MKGRIDKEGKKGADLDESGEKKLGLGRTCTEGTGLCQVESKSPNSKNYTGRFRVTDHGQEEVLTVRGKAEDCRSDSYENYGKVSTTRGLSPLDLYFVGLVQQFTEETNIQLCSFWTFILKNAPPRLHKKKNISNLAKRTTTLPRSTRNYAKSKVRKARS